MHQEQQKQKQKRVTDTTTATITSIITILSNRKSLVNTHFSYAHTLRKINCLLFFLKFFFSLYFIYNFRKISYLYNKNFYNNKINLQKQLYYYLFDIFKLFFFISLFFA